jgi:hypothetical protein
MQPIERRMRTPGILIAFVLLAYGTPARASDSELDATAREARVREIVRLVTRPERESEVPVAIARHAFELDRRGLHFRRDLTLGERDCEFRIGGPIYKSAKQKRFGVVMELRF